MLYVACLYLMLGSPDHAVRESASRQLAERISGYPHLYGPRVAEWAKRTRDPEIAFRARRLVKIHRNWQAAMYRPPEGVPVWPCSDMVPGPSDSEPRDRRAAAPWYDRLTHEPIPDYLATGPYWHRYRMATEDYCRDLIRSGTDPRQVDRLLSRMWAIELRYEADMTGIRPLLETWTWNGGYPHP